MITIQFNQENIQCHKDLQLDQLLMQQGYSGDHFAVAVNRHFVPRPHYSQVQIKEHDHIEIITAMQGG